ncbi:hypothetical protein ACFWBF_08270 [Streptomyces sp. NPDC060028]|uniref:hypothetical protein n=1 Tax=Streptomyces sp. NPDC060028 TaxID=3347041 RepID=UPI0036B2AF00
MSQFSSHGDNTAVNTSTGIQNVTYNWYSGPWIQVVAMIVVVVGLVIGISMLPKGSGAQRTWYVVILAVCAVLCALCLWSLCGRGTQPPGWVGALTLGVVACATLSALCYQQLSAHGDLSVSVVVNGDGSLADKAVVTATVDAAASRSHLRLRAQLPDHYPTGMCAVDSTVTVAPVVNGTAQTGEAIRLRDGEMGYIDLHGTQGGVRLRAVVEAAKGCLLDLRFVDVALYDKDGWLL